MTKRKLLLLTCLCSLACAARAWADPETFTGTFAGDDSTFSYMLTNTMTTTYDFYTTSYAGGMNADGTMTAGGGFVPVLTLFNSSGAVVDQGGAGGLAACGGAVGADAATGLCDDAFLTDMLAAGSYKLVLSEFPNYPTGGPNDPFMAGGDAAYTASFCGGGGSFQEADVAPCVQRTDAYTVNIAAQPTVPEPATWLLVLPGGLALAALGRFKTA